VAHGTPRNTEDAAMGLVREAAANPKNVLASVAPNNAAKFAFCVMYLSHYSCNETG
jgi:hypothetical protein